MKRLRNILLAPARVIRAVGRGMTKILDGDDVQLLGGLVLIFYGVYQMAPHWAFIVVGSVLALRPIVAEFKPARLATPKKDR